MSLKITGILLIILILCNIEAYAYREKSKLRVPMAFEGKAGMRQGEIATLREYLKEAYKLEIKPGITLLGLIENLEKAKKLYAEALEILRPGDSLVIKIQGKIAYLNRSIKMLWGKARLEETAMASFRADVERIKVLSGQSQREDAYDPEFLYGYEVGMNNKEPADDGGGLRAKIRLLLKAGWKKRTVLVEAKNPDSHIGVFLRGLVQPNSVNQQEILEALKMLKKKKPSVGAIRRGRLQDAKDLRAELKPVIEKKGIKEVFLRTGVSTYTLRSFLRGSNRGITAPLYQKLRAYLSSL